MFKEELLFLINWKLTVLEKNHIISEKTKVKILK